jgi:hypothetical protein
MATAKTTFTRFRMQMTYNFVDVVGGVLHKIGEKARDIRDPWTFWIARTFKDAPWVFWIGSIPVCFQVSIFLSPYLNEYLPGTRKDRRTIAENRRVLECLQRGIDPYPFLRFRDYISTGGSWEGHKLYQDQVPRECNHEYRAMSRWREARRDQFMEVQEANEGRRVQQGKAPTETFPNASSRQPSMRHASGYMPSDVKAS